jgi:hypothetical protein
LIFYAEIIFDGSSGQVAAVDENSSIFAGIAAQFFNNSLLASQTARLFLMSAAKFDIAGERAYIDQPKTVIRSPAAVWGHKTKYKGNNSQRQQAVSFHFYLILRVESECSVLLSQFCR